MRQSSAGPAPRSDGPPPPSPPSSDLAEGLAVPEHPHSAQPGGGKDRGGGGGAESYRQLWITSGSSALPCPIQA